MSTQASQTVPLVKREIKTLQISVDHELPVGNPKIGVRAYAAPLFSGILLIPVLY